MDSMAPRKETLNILEIAADAALDKLGKDLVAVDLTEQMVLSEVFLIVTGQNERQIDAIAENIELKLSSINERPVRREKIVTLDSFGLRRLGGSYTD